jgi:hypothetical protein
MMSLEVVAMELGGGNGSASVEIQFSGVVIMGTGTARAPL